MLRHARHVTLCYVMLCCVVLYYVMLSSFLFCSALFCYVILCCVMLCYVSQSCFGSDHSVHTSPRYSVLQLLRFLTQFAASSWFFQSNQT